MTNNERTMVRFHCCQSALLYNWRVAMKRSSRLNREFEHQHSITRVFTVPKDTYI